MTALADRAMHALVPPEARPLALLPARQAGWMTATVAVGAGLWMSGLWSSHPELSLSLALSAGPVAAFPRRAWALPLISGAVVLAAMGSAALAVPPVLAMGAVLGLAAGLLWPERTDALDLLNATLATTAGAGLGLWAAVTLLPGLQETLLGTLLLVALVGLVTSQGLLPLALRPERDGLPGRSRIQRTLTPPYRPPVHRALELHGRAVPHAPDKTTKKGLAEVATWVYTLQLTLQSHDQALGTIDPVQVQQRIDAAHATDTDDTFTQERRQATAAHLERLLEHRRTLQAERGRTEALVDYALAFLEEATASLALARQLPGEAGPDRLPEVLHRLRAHADAGSARRQTARELEGLAV